MSLPTMLTIIIRFFNHYPSKNSYVSGNVPHISWIVSVY